jgi:para-nitrobenzyl esterase
MAALCVLLLSTIVAAAGVQAAEFVEIDTVYGRIRGIKELNPDVTAFYGVPFARPPLGALRWAPPQLPLPWTDTRDCTRDLFFHVRGELI